MLRQCFFDNPLSAWLIALAVGAAAYFALIGLRYLVVRRLSKYAAVTSTGIDDALIDLLGRTKRLFVAVVAIGIGSAALSLDGDVRRYIRLAMVLAFAVQGALWANGLVTFWIQRYAEQRARSEPASVTTLRAIGLAIRFALWTILFLVALDTLGINVTALVTGLGITGIAVALAVQNILGDLFGALTIVLDKPFVLGDAIEVDAVSGTVERIGLKTTRIRSVNGELIAISNGDLLKSRIRNYRQMTERRALIVTTLSPETTPEDLARAPRLLEDVVAAIPLVRLERSRLRAVTDAGFEIETTWYVQSPEFRVFADARQAVLLGIAATFRREHIALAFRAVPAAVDRGATTPASLPLR